ncbi:MAG: NfeD family protein [Acidobacteria bacterium]|nr:NfeD family protein [Acidobacteriota bacterium]
MMLWWHWAVLGLLLAAAELLTPGGFFVIFFGLAGLVVAVLVAVGLAEPLWLQILFFSIVSVGALLLFRNPLLRWMARNTPPPIKVDNLVGEVAVTAAAIEPGGMGRAELRGASWSARNGGAARIEAGTRCRVTRVDGLEIWIQAE